MKQITTALIAFQKQIGKIKKDSKNPFFKSSYASLPNILDTVNPVLVECDLAIVQMPTGDGQLKTILAHTSGECIESEFDMKIVKSDPQALGSAITYARRYAIGAILNLNIDDDDDANAAMPSPANTAQADDKKWLNATDKSGKLNSTGEKTAHKLASGETTWQKIEAVCKVSKKDREAVQQRASALIEELNNNTKPPF
jgi:hypothetical protein